MDEISEDSEKLPPTVKLTLLQTAVRSINDLRIVETFEEFQSPTYRDGSSTSLSYQTYYDLLINACVRYDKTKKANIGKRRNVYNTNIDNTYVDHPTAFLDHVPDSPYGGIDLLPDEFYQVHTLPLGTHLLQDLVILPDPYYDLLINACVRYDKTKKTNIGKRRNVYTTNIDDTYVDHLTACIDHVPNSPYGGIDLPPDAFFQVHTLSSRHPHSPRPGNPSRPSFRPPSCLLKSISY